MKRYNPHDHPPYVSLTYEELGDYVGIKSIIKVSAEWFETICSKECSKCKTLLQLNEFNNDKRRKFGKRSQCKSCSKDGSPKVAPPQFQEESKIEYKLVNLNE